MDMITTMLEFSGATRPLAVGGVEERWSSTAEKKAPCPLPLSPSRICLQLQQLEIEHRHRDGHGRWIKYGLIRETWSRHAL
jgi:hypothetical protein